MASSAQIVVSSYGYTYSFSGVISVRHEFALKISTDNESAGDREVVTGVRNQPDKVTLTVIETDVGHIAGRADRMIQAMEALKRTRTRCEVVTSARTYTDMLLSEFTAVIDETSQSGWQGTLTFTQYLTQATAAKTNNNSSTPAHTGSAGQAQTVTGSPLQQMLRRAGIEI